MSWLDKIKPSFVSNSNDSDDQRSSIPEGLWKKCVRCDAVLYRPELERNLDVCPKCNHHMRIDARRRLDIFLDESPRIELATDVEPIDRLKFKDTKKYKDRLSQALKNTGEKVALKKISKRFTNSSVFHNETEALLRIYENGGHPGISGLRDMYEDFSHFYLILDLIKGGEMFEHLANQGAFSEADGARLIFEVASALCFLHGVGIVHNDLKPENLLLCSKNRRDGTIKIIDFGCATTLQPENLSMDRKKGSEADSEENGGTVGYFAPEKFQSVELSPAVDIWAIGVILFIMLTGVHPFDPEVRAQQLISCLLTFITHVS